VNVRSQHTVSHPNGEEAGKLLDDISAIPSESVCRRHRAQLAQPIPKTILPLSSLRSPREGGLPSPDSSAPAAQSVPFLMHGLMASPLRVAVEREAIGMGSIWTSSGKSCSSQRRTFKLMAPHMP